MSENYLWEPGDYEAEFMSASLMESTNGKPYIESNWKVIDPEDPEGETFIKTVRTFVSEKAFETSVKKLEMNGFNGDFNSPEFFPEDNVIILRCTHDTYNDKDVERWDFANWGAKKADKSTAQLLSAKYKKEMAKSGKKSKAKNSAAPSTSREVDKNIDVEQIRADCWSKLEETISKHMKEEGQIGEVDQDEMNLQWSKKLREMFEGKKESELTVKDWKEFLDYVATPF